jgi:uncharacterized protein YcbK (DUF882 family)
MRLVTVAALSFFATLAHGGKKTHKAEVPPEDLPPPVELVSRNTHEHYKLQPDAQGQLQKKQLKGFARFMRCWHTGRVHAMNPRLPKLLYEIGRHYDHSLLVYDGYRAPKVARKKGNPKSPHPKGLACDFEIDGVTHQELRDYLYTTYDNVGVGYYPNSHFVHLDVRGRGKAFWVDYSFPDQRQSKAMYSKKSWEQVKADEEAFAQSSEHEEGVPPPETAAAAIAPAAIPTPTSAAPLPKPAQPQGGAAPQGNSSPGAATPKTPPTQPASP